MSIKRGCQWSFIAKHSYLNPSLCQLIYLNHEHKNKQGDVCHGKVVVGYWHALGSQLSNSMKAHLKGLLWQGLFLAQVMTHHKAYVRKKVLKNEPITQDTFVLPSNVKNLSRKKVDDLWQKHPKDPMSVQLSHFNLCSFSY